MTRRRNRTHVLYVLLKEFGYDEAWHRPGIWLRRLPDGKTCILAEQEAVYALDVGYRRFEDLMAYKERTAVQAPGA